MPKNLHRIKRPVLFTYQCQRLEEMKYLDFILWSWKLEKKWLSSTFDFLSRMNKKVSYSRSELNNYLL